MAYDDATNRNFWVKLKSVSIECHGGRQFPDGSRIIEDPMGCSLSATA